LWKSKAIDTKISCFNLKVEIHSAIPYNDDSISLNHQMQNTSFPLHLAAEIQKSAFLNDTLHPNLESNKPSGD
jgi:hypothetical protein